VIAEAHEVGAEIETELDPLPQANANRVQVAQVLVNLLRNAIEAVAENPGKDRLVKVHARQRGPQILVCVSDNGPGVDPDLTLFTQFETTKPGGMGLGLSICRSIVQENGGQLWHEPAETVGARFCFTLDASADS
jgi:C4-dicarboxylate-specific signal transduction histidine kinase